MSSTEAEQPEPLIEKTEQESAQTPEKTPGRTETIEPATDADHPAFEPLITPETLSVQRERFSSLSSEMAELLSLLTQEVKKASDQLLSIRSAVDLKKQELETLNQTFAAVKQSIDDSRLHKENLERFMASQRIAWEEERQMRARQEEKYLESLKIQRQREEEEHRQKLAADHLRAQQKLEEELKAIHQRNLEKQRAVERDWLEREQLLKERELEWIQLIQELEQFMSTLSRHTQSRVAGRVDAARRISTPPPNLPSSNSDAPQKEDAPQHAVNSGDAPKAERTSEMPHSASGQSRNAIFGNAPISEPKPSIPALREMLLSQERRIENLSARLSEKRDSSPLKFPSSDPEIFKSEG